MRYLPTPHSLLPTPPHMRRFALLTSALRSLRCHPERSEGSAFLLTSGRSLTVAARILASNFSLLTSLFLLVTRHLSLVTVLCLTRHLSLVTAFAFLLVTCHSSLVTVLSAQGIITTVAGNGRIFRGNGGPATSAALGFIYGVAVDSAGNVFATDQDNNLVVKISPTGIITVVAGNNIAGFSGDGGPATSASLNFPFGVAVDGVGNLYIADRNNARIRKVSPDGTITTVAGNGRYGFSGDGGPAANASFWDPDGIALDPAGNLYVADQGNHRIRKIGPGGIVTTVAGSGPIGLEGGGFSGDGEPATNALLNEPFGVAVDGGGNLYIADQNNNRVRKVSPAGIITTVAGNGVPGYSGDGGPATSAALVAPEGVAIDAAGNLYIATNVWVRKVSPGRIISTFAGSGQIGFSGDGGPAVSASLNFPYAVTSDVSGNVYIADTQNARLRKVSLGGSITTIAGIGYANFSGDGGAATTASLSRPSGLAVDSAGSLYIADVYNYRIRKIGAGGTIATVAGNGVPGSSGDGGPATNASLNEPVGVAVDGVGSLYITEFRNNHVRKASPAGIITTIVGTGVFGFSGDGGPAANATLGNPSGIALDAAGNLYIADTFNHRIRKVTSAGIITTVAGSGPIGVGRGGFSGDGGPATSALLNGPFGVAVDAAGNLYVADFGNNRIRKVMPSGIISTVAGGGSVSNWQNGDSALAVRLFSPKAVTVDLAGNLYIGENNAANIDKVGLDGTITYVAGTGETGFSGDGGPATNAILNSPEGVVLDTAGNIYISDRHNDRIRKVLAGSPSFAVAPASLNFTVLAGTGEVAPQRVALTSSVIGLAWGAEVATESGGNWLSVSPTVGAMPSVVDVKVDVANLTPGVYRGTVTSVAPLAAVPIQSVAVNLTVETAPTAKLTVEPSSLTFETQAGGNPPARTLRISNAGGGSLNWAARSETTSGGNWLSVSPASGSVSGGMSNTVPVVASSSTLAAGVYSGAVVVESATSGETLRVPVSLLVSQSRQTILVSQSGLLFTGVEGGSLVPPQSFGVLNTGEGVMSWTAQASTLAGGNWLTVSPREGTSDAASLRVPLVNVAVNVAGLSAGQYSGLIRVNAPTANNSPQFVTVELNVLPRGSNPGVLVRPTGLIFAAQAGTSSPGSQTVNLGTVTPGNVDAVSGLLTRDGVSWLEAVPRNLTLSAGDAIQRIVVQPTLGSLAPGVYRGALTLLFSDSSPAQVVNILFLVVSGRVGAAGASPPGEVQVPRRYAPRDDSERDSMGPLAYARGSDSSGPDSKPSEPRLSEPRP